jgi:hypothetical protein
MLLQKDSAAQERRAKNAVTGLTNVSRDEFSHLEHAHLALSVEYGPERVVGVDLRSLFFVLKAVPLDVVPKLFGEFGTGQWRRTNDGSEFVVRLHRPHKGWIQFTFRSLFGFRHKG